MDNRNSKESKVSISAVEVVDYCFNDINEYPSDIQDLFYIDRYEIITSFIRELEDSLIEGGDFYHKVKRLID